MTELLPRSPSLPPFELELTPLEIASGLVLGGAPLTHRGMAVVDGETPLAALERAVLPALLRPPCLVSFSGGMDSSFVLAVATRAARRHGLPSPVPVSWRFTDAPRADETDRQDRVVAALGLTDRLLLPAGDDLDFVGPVAAGLLRERGVLYPANLHLHLPLLEQAAGGSLLTGIGGDQVLSNFSHRPLGLGARARRAVPAGWHLRLRQLRRRHDLDHENWLHRDVARGLQLCLLAEAKTRPVRPSSRLRWQVSRRALVMGCENLQTLAADHAVAVVNPLLDRGFHEALNRLAGTAGPLDRAGLLGLVAGTELPVECHEFRAKARFDRVFLRDHARHFLARWTGDGIPGEFVDPVALKKLWSSWPFRTNSALLLQSIWLGQQ